jgi:hypothetical protein
MNVRWQGVPLDPPAQLFRVPVSTVEFAVPMSEAEYERWRTTVSERDWRITLPAGQRVPPYFRRGQAIDFTVRTGEDAYHLVGRVRFRRLNLLVITARSEASVRVAKPPEG